MQVKLSSILEEFRERATLVELIGPDVEVRNIASVDESGPGDLVFVAREELFERALGRKPAAIVMSVELAAARPAPEGISVLAAKKVGVAHALIRQHYVDRDVRNSEFGPRHASAVIHESAQLHDSVIVGPQAVIGAGTSIGADAVVMAGVVIEDQVQIGERTVIHPNVVIGQGCRVGRDVIIKAGTIVGSEGFGFEQDEQKRSHRVPQLGTVVIEDDVVLGANNCIDRATYAKTVIGRGTKTDNLCHFAHNVIVGEDCLLTAGFIVAGSTRIGDRVIASGQTGVLDHLKVSADTIFVHRAGITTDVDKPGIYAGLPLQPLQKYLKNAAVAGKLTELRMKVRELEKQVQGLTGDP